MTAPGAFHDASGRARTRGTLLLDKLGASLRV
jgi:hypothetical protein